MNDDVREAIERLSGEPLRYDAHSFLYLTEVRTNDVTLVLRELKEAQHAAGPRYLIRDGQSIDEVHTAGLLELLLEQTNATLDDLRVITALGIGGCHDVETDSGAVVRIERVKS